MFDTTFNVFRRELIVLNAIQTQAFTTPEDFTHQVGDLRPDIVDTSLTLRRFSKNTKTQGLSNISLLESVEGFNDRGQLMFLGV